MNSALYVRDIPPRLSTTPRPLLEEAPVQRLPRYVYVLAILSVLVVAAGFGVPKARAEQRSGSQPYRASAKHIAVKKVHTKWWMTYPTHGSKKAKYKAAVKRAKHDYTVSEVKSVIRWVAKKKGCTKSETRGLIRVARRESTFDNKCRTGSFGGVMQIYRKHHKWWADPYWNTAVAINDMRRHYGSVAAGVDHSDRYGWY